MRKKLIGIGAGVLVLALLLLTLAPACGKGEEKTPTPGITPTPGVTPTPTPEVKTLKMGLLVPLSGAGAAWGRMFEQGFDFAIDKINAAGGVKVGSDIYMINGIEGDTKYLGSAAAKEATRMVYEEGIHYMVGPIGTQKAIQPIIDEGKCFMACSSPSIDLGPDYPYNIATAAPDPFWFGAFWEQGYRFHPEIKTVTIVSPDPNRYDAATEACKAIHEAHGSEMVMVKRYTQFATDYYPVLTSVVAKNPDAIDFDSATHGDIDLMIKQIRELGYEGMLFGPTYGDPTSAIEIAGVEYTEGFCVNDPDYGSDLYPEETRQLYAEFQQRYPGAPFATATFVALLPVYMYAAAIEQAGSIDPDEVMKVFDDPDFEYEAWGVSGRKIGGYETYGIRRCIQDEVCYSEVINGVKVMKSRQPVVIP